MIAVGLAGCGSGGGNSADSAGCTEIAARGDAGNAAEAATPADRTAVVEVASETPSETPTPSTDASSDEPAPPDLAAPADSPAATPDAGAGTDAAADVAKPADVAPTETAKVVDAAAVDAAKPSPDLAPAMLAEISPQQLKTALANKDFLLIDVHYPNAGSIQGTDARIAFDDIPALVAFIGSDLSRKVVLTCYSGHMSKQAGDALVARGYRNISELTGGTTAWISAGYTVVRLDGGL